MYSYSSWYFSTVMTDDLYSTYCIALTRAKLSVQIPKSCVVVYTFTICYFRSYDYLASFPQTYQSCFSCLLFATLDSILILAQLKAILVPIFRTTLFIIRLHIFVLLICLLTNNEPCDQDPFIPTFSIHDFSKCMNEHSILSRSMISSMSPIFLTFSLPISTIYQSSPSMILLIYFM